MSVKEVVEVMDKKTMRNWTAEGTDLFCSIFLDLVIKFMLTLERKVLKKAATKEVFEAILEELKTTSMEDHSKLWRESCWKVKSHWKEIERQKNGSGLTGTQDQTWYQILNPVLRDTNQGMDGICSNTADASLSDFFRQEEKNKEVDEGEGESDAF